MHQVLLALVELHLAAGEESEQHVDTSSDEAVVAHLVVQSVDPVGWVRTEEDNIRKTTLLNH